MIISFLPPELKGVLRFFYLSLEDNIKPHLNSEILNVKMARSFLNWPTLLGNLQLAYMTIIGWVGRWVGQFRNKRAILAFFTEVVPISQPLLIRNHLKHKLIPI